jgi:hypothetical protein
MTNRPCKPDADLRGIWQMLLPDVPFPACRAPNAEPSTDSKSTTPVDGQVDRHNEQVRREAAGAQPQDDLI